MFWAEILTSKNVDIGHIAGYYGVNNMGLIWEKSEPPIDHDAILTLSAAINAKERNDGN